MIVVVLNPVTELSCLFFTEHKQYVQMWLYEQVVIMQQRNKSHCTMHNSNKAFKLTLVCIWSYLHCTSKVSASFELWKIMMPESRKELSVMVRGYDSEKFPSVVVNNLLKTGTEF